MIRFSALAIVVLCLVDFSGEATAERNKRPPLPMPECEGCEGQSGSDSASGDGTCEGIITISVWVSDGSCIKMLVGEYPAFRYECVDVEPCHATISRTWTGIPAGVPMDFCVDPGSGNLCIEPKPDSGSGTGSDHKDYDMQCGWDDWTWSFSVPSCGGMSASVTGGCSSCD